MNSNMSVSRKEFLAIGSLGLMSIAGLAACGGNSSSSSDSNGDTTTTANITYFDSCAELPKPDSIIDVSEGISGSSSTGGYVTKELYSFSFNNKDNIEDETNKYIEALKDCGLTVNETAESAWEVLVNDSRAATLEVDSDSSILTVTIYPEGNRTSVKEVSLGQYFETDTYSFTLNEITWEKEIYPPDVSGSYIYYPEEANKTYCVITGSFKYLGGDSYNIANTSAAFSNMNGKYNFSGTVEYAYGTGIGSNGLNSFTHLYSIEPLNEVPLYIYASIPNEVADNFTEGVLEWTLTDGTEYVLNLV